MQIHELPTSGVSDTDKLAFDTGANTYSGTFSSIASSVLSKLTSLTFSALNTSNKTLPGAINELNNNLTVKKSTTYTASNSYCSANYSYTQCGGVVIVSVMFTPSTTISGDIGDITLVNLPSSPPNTIVSATACVTQTVSTALGPAYVTASKVFHAYGPRTSGQSYRATFVYMV